MGVVLVLVMDKPMQIKQGFTLIEMILVLFIISMFLVFIPRLNFSLNDYYALQTLSTYLIKAQNEANYDNRTIHITVYENTLVIDGKNYYIDLLNVEYASFSYNEFGNINHALSIYSKNSDTKLVLQLGSGNYDIR